MYIYTGDNPPIPPASICMHMCVCVCVCVCACGRA